LTTLLVDGIPLLERPELVLFDKDGTLIDIHHYWVSMINLRSDLIIKRYFKGRSTADEVRYALIDAMGVGATNNRMKPDGPVGIKPRHFIVKVATQTIRNHGVEVEESDTETLFSEVDRNTSNDLLPLLKILPGVTELLVALNEKNIPAAVVSTDITSRATAAIEVLGLGKYFKTIIGGDAVVNTKPAPDLALAAATYCNVQTKHSVVIGDHPVDILMGQKAGCGLNIGVLNGLSNRMGFANLDCTLIPDLTHITVR
jgi:phosphoglycolate phosphatase